jgi:hypothetical protein
MPSHRTFDSKRIIASAKRFFSRRELAGQLPPVLGQPGGWVTFRSETFRALFYLTQPSFEQVRRHRASGWHPFPALFAPTQPVSVPVFIAMEGRDGFFDSNVTKNGYAFRVGPNASFIVHNHRIVLDTDPETSVDYVVDLAFVLGEHAGARFKTQQAAFQHLFRHLVDVWTSSQT